VTILTDIADTRRTSGSSARISISICGSDQAVEQALALGHPETKVHRVSGMILNPRFYETRAAPAASAARRARVWIRSGAARWGWSYSAARARRKCSRCPDYPDRNWLLICGHTRSWRLGLRRFRQAPGFSIEGFTGKCRATCSSRINFIGKPGRQHQRGGAMRLPVIVERNAGRSRRNVTTPRGSRAASNHTVRASYETCHVADWPSLIDTQA